MINNSMFTALNDLDTATDNIAVSLDMLDLVLENLGKTAVGARKGDPAAAAHFLQRYDYFGRMLFLLLDQIQTQNLQSQDFLGQAWKAFHKEQEVRA